MFEIDYDYVFGKVMMPMFKGDDYYFSELKSHYPFCDIYYDKKENLIFKFALAGFKKENLKVVINDGMLNVSGNINKEDFKDICYEIEGIKKSTFNEYYKLPRYYESEPNVSFIDGILLIEFTKNEEAKAKTIEIK